MRVLDERRLAAPPRSKRRVRSHAKNLLGLHISHERRIPSTISAVAASGLMKRTAYPRRAARKPDKIVTGRPVDLSCRARRPVCSRHDKPSAVRRCQPVEEFPEFHKPSSARVPLQGPIHLLVVGDEWAGSLHGHVMAIGSRILVCVNEDQSARSGRDAKRLSRVSHADVNGCAHKCLASLERREAWSLPLRYLG